MIQWLQLWLPTFVKGTDSFKGLLATKYTVMLQSLAQQLMKTTLRDLVDGRSSFYT